MEKLNLRYHIARDVTKARVSVFFSFFKLATCSEGFASLVCMLSSPALSLSLSLKYKYTYVSVLKKKNSSITTTI